MSKRAEVALYLRASNLPKMDMLSQSDPFVVIYEQTPETNEWKEVHRTATIDNQKNPQWPEPFVTQYHFEQIQKLRFEVYDRDSKEEDLEKQELIGYIEICLSSVFKRKDSKLVGKLKRDKGKKLGKKVTFGITGQVQGSMKSVLHFCFRGKGIQKRNLMGLGSSDPFYRISQEHSDGRFFPVFESEHIKRTSNPKWKPQKVSLQRICNNDTKKQIKFEVFDWEKSGKHRYIGAEIFSFQDFLEKKSFQLLNFKAKKKKELGEIHIDTFEIEEKASFIDYLQGGCELKLTIAVDFSATNGNPKEETWKHYVPDNFTPKYSDEYEPYNDYQKALYNVGRILEEYDSDKQLAAYCFGTQHEESSFFPLSLDNKNVELPGIAAVMEAYDNARKKLASNGENNLKEVIQNVIETTSDVTQDSQEYSVLLVITTGLISDLEETTELIVQASSKPISIIFIGIGNNSFQALETLDGDEVDFLVAESGATAERDIVQFVPFSETMKQGIPALTRETLAELPGQVEQYFWSKNIVPNK